MSIVEQEGGVGCPFLDVRTEKAKHDEWEIGAHIPMVAQQDWNLQMQHPGKRINREHIDEVLRHLEATVF